MILDRLEYADRYNSLHPYFAKAFSFLRQTQLDQLPSGIHEIDDKRVYALVALESGRGRKEAKLEAHQKYIDIQVPLSGTDEIGWKSRLYCSMPEGQYDEDRDCELFTDTPDSWITVSPGNFVIFFPEDAHAPLAATGRLHKIVIKVICTP